MADNINVTEGVGRTVATDEIGGISWQRVKIGLGADGTAVDWLGGAGAVSAAVARVTLGSDDPAVASLAILDDWDESDRAKVNLIVGQAGIAAGAGVTGVTVPRVIEASDSPLSKPVSGHFERVAASQTNQVLGPTGALGDYIARIVIVPATTATGQVLLIDSATSYTIFTGATWTADLKPLVVELGMYSVEGSWRITTGANLSVIAIGRFT